MAYRAPHSLSTFCRRVLPLLQQETDGRRILGSVSEIVETDRWNSFDRFHDTTDTLVRQYALAGAGTEVHSVPTGGRIGSGRWVVQQAADVRGATVDVVRPVRERVLDYRENPWHVAQWSAATPSGGVLRKMVILDTPEALERTGRDGLVGKVVLTRMDLRSQYRAFADRGVAAVLSDRPVPGLAGALPWTKLGWGGKSLDSAAVHLVGLVLSQRQGTGLRRLAARAGELTLRVKVDVRSYVGSHDLVSGLIPGREDPQDELWVLAHGAEPGALDNASGVAVCLEIARVIASLAERGVLPRPRRTLRLLSGYECYSFFHYAEHVRRFQTPLAGACVDTVGARPSVCDGRLSWRATIPMSAGFVDRVGASVIRSTLRLSRPGYRLTQGPFVSTSDTLLGDPEYGFPCPWLTNHYRKGGKTWAAYHTSADTVNLLSTRGLAACAAAMAGYLYYLAEAGTREVGQLATAETNLAVEELSGKVSSQEADTIRLRHSITLRRLRRWLWGGCRSEVETHLRRCEGRVADTGPRRRGAGRRAKRTGLVPVRRVPVSPTLENTPEPIAKEIRDAKLPPWTLFWADGRRDLDEIVVVASAEQRKDIGAAQVAQFFRAHAKLGYVELVDKGEMVSAGQIACDLRDLGVARGMDVMVHSSLSRIGHVHGGAEAVVDAVLSVVGKRGTVLMPSFNHRRARVFNPLTTPTSNGAIPDAFWRRPEAVRSEHPTHAVSAIGPRAAELCRDHLERGVWTADSPLSRFVHSGGYVLSVGVTHTASTVYHVAEVSVPCGCIDPFGHTDCVVARDGKTRSVPGLAFRSGPCPVSVERLDVSLGRSRAQRSGKVGRADATLVPALEIWRARRRHLKAACPSCGVKPRVRGRTAR